MGGAVDRAHYYLEGQRNSAYYDIAWKHDNLHLSAPCIYSEVMEQLDLRPGQSFLNLGSGTGYLSTMAGLLLGPYGVNHGIELHQDVVEYALKRLEEFVAKCPYFDKYEFCHPLFRVGNCLFLQPDIPGYDRIYCGGACPPEYEDNLKKLLNIDGKLVLPINGQLNVYRRLNETEWDYSTVLAVSFAQLVIPDPQDGRIEPTVAPKRNVLQLKELCRFCIRRVIRRRHKCPQHPKFGLARRKLQNDTNTFGVPTSSRRRPVDAETSARTRRRRTNTAGDSDVTSNPDMDQNAEGDTGRSHEDEALGRIESNESANSAADQTSLRPENSGNEIHRADLNGVAPDGSKSNSSSESSRVTGGDPVESRPTHRIRLGHTSSHNNDRPRNMNRRSHGRNNRLLDRRAPVPLAVEDAGRYLGFLDTRQRRGLLDDYIDYFDGDVSELESSDSDEGCEHLGSEEEYEFEFPPLTETDFVVAIRKLPLPARLISYLMYHRQ